MPATALLFTYGSLMFPDVWERVVRGRYRSAPATAADMRRRAVANESYPGMIESPGGAVTGVVYFDVDAADLAALDAFEGPDYRRILLPVMLSSGETLLAATYLYRDPSRLTSEDWDPARFELQRFLGSYCGFDN